MLPCFQHGLYRMLCSRCAHGFFLLPFFLFLSSFDFVSSWFEKISFPLSSNERISSAPFFDLHRTTQLCHNASCLPLAANFPFHVLIGPPMLLLLVLFPSPEEQISSSRRLKERGCRHRRLSFNSCGTIDLLQCS